MIRRLAALLALLGMSAVRCEAETVYGHWDHHQYHPMRQANLSCAVGFLCEIVLEPGEQLRNGFTPEPSVWDPHVGYAGDGILTPHLILKPRRPGLATNLIITTNRRVYRIYVRAVVAQEPTYMFYHYDTERRAATPSPVSTPFNAQIACTRASLAEYRITGPDPWRPTIACNDGGHTYMQMVRSSTVPTDLPVVFARIDRDRKDQIVNWTYDAGNRVYRVDGVFEHLILAVGRERINIVRTRAS
jgi:type IV secretion system protein VirB9